MRKMQLVLGAIIVAGLAGIDPAHADYDYPWCIQGAAYDYPGDCSYQTREQCLLSVSGRKGYCGQNPAFLITRPRLPPTLPGRQRFMREPS